jgi:ketosteroid isomerase-like protein
MRHYWQSDRLTFSSDGHTRRSWTETKTRCEQRYPTPERMGQLEFTDLETHLLGDNAALVLGHWHLTCAPDYVGGSSTLVFELIDGQWKIIHDHTSATPPKELPPSDEPWVASGRGPRCPVSTNCNASACMLPWIGASISSVLMQSQAGQTCLSSRQVNCSSLGLGSQGWRGPQCRGSVYC